jgi:hypothetical protein
VHAEELRSGGRGRLAPVEPELSVGLELGLDRPQPRGVLGMGAGVVIVGGRMMDVEPHAGVRYPAPLPLPPPGTRPPGDQAEVAVVGAGAAGPRAARTAS